MNEVDKKAKVPSICTETLQIIKLLRTTSVGQIITWDELEKLTSIPRSRVYSLVRTARNTLENEDKMHFATRPTAGVERIDFNAVARETLPGQRKRIVGAANRMVKTTRNVILDEMDQECRTTVLVHQTLAELTRQALSKKSEKRLADDFDKARQLTPFTAKEAMERMLGG